MPTQSTNANIRSDKGAGKSMSIFDNIDFENLPLGYGEQDVREDIVAPILKALGYSAFDDRNTIIREPRLEHPFTRFGTKNFGCEIADYLIRVNGQNAFIVEAKAPSQDILSFNCVTQAYSYAINIEVQVKRFMLCNGREMGIFDVNQKEPLSHFKLAEAGENEWGRVYELLSPFAFTNPHIFNYLPDYGIWCIRNGKGPEVVQYFYNCHITDIARLDDNTFTIMAVIKEDAELLASFDFDISLFDSFLGQVPEALKDTVRRAVRQSPFKYITETEQDSFPLSFSARLGEAVFKNGNEDYLPLKVVEFI